ncbi:aldehyde ferredoxin oxidoreductase C-terminal domain-containing protein [Caldinitratiruptor microaerophilus]|uniref:Aldehyde ferredoxin oxidoreductase n=1 Tax=Caldinitratiruptor microaerophilus TaxID=671077 RepID=A0AA35CKV5_9FIRM|nr:aldehyde ferredoxin oxidoreductase C-terminal domain-containing protein [Caldinitratiruptor microaerophilus]BDG59186.1 aldehyde ferredoxin oxidoreductase [Caldinitratiruptor microaerophilus]
MDRILRVDMAALAARVEPLPQEYRLLGGRALTSRIVADEVDPRCDPLGPKNKLVLAPGLLSGTPLSSSSRISAGAKSPLTGGIKESNGGGQTGARLAQLGYRAVVIEGAPSGNGWWLMVVEPNGARFEPADDLLGLGTFETARRLFDRFGKKAALMVLGPAGEQMMNIAGICNTDVEGRPSRLCARGGLGAVMGSKRLKAIVMPDCGWKPPVPVDESLWKIASKAYIKELRTQPATSVRYPQFGTAATLELVNKLGGLPIRNFRYGQDPRTDAISGFRMREIILKRGGRPTHSCMTGCAIQCSNVYTDEEGNEIASSMEFETNGLLGANLEVFDFDAIARFTRECNDLGVDTIETGGAIGVAMEAGLIPWGDVDGIFRLFREIRSGTVLGKLLGQGAGTTGKVLGVRRVPVVKNQTLSAYDPRAIKGNGVTYVTTPMGGDHTAGNTIALQIDHLDPAGKVAISRQIQLQTTLLDVLGFCSFARGVLNATPQTFADLFNARMGSNLTPDDMMAYALDVIRREVRFNVAAGQPAYERLPEWMREEPLPPHNAVFDVPEEEYSRIWDL